MTLRVPEDIDALRRQRDAMLRLAEGQVEEVVGRAIKKFLRLAKAAARSSLTAAAPQMPRMASELFTLGEMNTWWADAVDREVQQEVMSVWNRGRSEASDLAMTQRSLDASGEYLAQVKDRLTNRDGSLPQTAFDQVRIGLADEMARGSSNSVISRRIASDLNWTGPDRGLWESRLSQADQSIDAILDPLGPPGSLAREAARLNDPQVRALQQSRSQAVKALDADRSTWETRASLIARTETTAAYNAGALSAFNDEQAGVKAWISTLDDRTRESHLVAYGQCVPLGQAFRIGQHMMEMPGDPRAPSQEVANCRCTMIAGRNCEEVGGWAASGTDVARTQAEGRGLIGPDEPLPTGPASTTPRARPSSASDDRFESAAKYEDLDSKLNELQVRIDAAGAEFGDYAPETVQLYFQRDVLRRDFENRVFRTTADWSSDAALLKARDAYVVADDATLRMNATLRKQAGRSAPSARAQKIDDLVETSRIQTDTVLHRGISMSDDFAESLTPGLRMTDHGFQSTAMDVGEARFYVGERAADIGGDQTRVLYRILAPDGTKAVNVGVNEVVLARGTTMEVVAARSAVEKGVKWRYVDVRIVND